MVNTPRTMFIADFGDNRGRGKASYLPVITEYTYGIADIITNILGALGFQ